jgi:hypothetical protein
MLQQTCDRINGIYAKQGVFFRARVVANYKWLPIGIDEVSVVGVVLRRLVCAIEHFPLVCLVTSLGNIVV